MPAQDPRIDPSTGRPWSVGRRIKRSLGRRFPRTRGLVLRLLHFGRRLAGALWHRFTGIGRTARWVWILARDVARRRRESRLTIAVDVTPFWESLTGVGWYLYRLLENLADRDDVRLRLYGPTAVASCDLAAPTVALPQGAALEPVVHTVPDDLVLPGGWIIRGLRLVEPALLALDANQVLFAPNYFLPRRFGLARGRRVATIHDLGSRKVPWTLQQETLAHLRSQLQRSTRRAARLIAVSGAVRDELVAYGYAPPEKIRVVHHGPGQLSNVLPGALPAGLPASFALHVGTLEPRKNILGLLEVWRQVRRAAVPVPCLVLCGRFGWKTEAIREAVNGAVAEGWLVHLGYVPEEELAALYRAARMLVFPTLYEGFGLPIVEAQHAGIPVVCSDLPVLREVAGDAALYAPSEDAAAVARQVLRLLASADLSAELARRGRARSALLSWQRAARSTASVWLEAATGCEEEERG